MRYRLSICFLFFLAVVNAQERPKVGLALSGGGAKCLAQLGALRAIEQSGITIDYISGTSMGAVIGAMYAMGYTVDEIEQTLAQVDWDQLLSGEIPRDRLPYFNRNDELYLLSIALEKGNFSLPKAFNYGHYMLKVLSILTMRHHDVTNFEDLPIPFLCMATDLETGEAIAFDHGSLTDALRASVAYPSIFSPYEINGRLYVDGGVRNNLPIAVLKEMKHMDYVIAIDVQGALYKKDELQSIVEVLEQVGSFPNMLYYNEQKELADVIIKPEIGQYDITSYSAVDSIIIKGYEATIAFLDTFSNIAQKQGFQPNVHTPRLATPLKEFPVDSVHITGVKPKEERIIRRTLNLEDTGMYSLERLDRGLDLLYGSRNYEKVEFQYIHKDTFPTAHIRLKPTSTRHSLRFGLHYDDDFSIALLSNYTLLNAGLLNSKFIAEAAISENPRGQIAYFLEGGLIPSIGLRLSFNRFQPRLYKNLEPVSQYNLFSFLVDLFTQRTFANNYTIGTGLRWNIVDLSESIPFLGVEESRNAYLIYHAFIDIDSRNRSFRPTKGFSIQSKANVIWPTAENITQEASSVVGLEYKQAISLSHNFGLEAGFTGAATIGGTLDYPFNVFVGGLGQNYINFTFPFIGYRFMELIGRNFGSINALVYYEPFENHFLTFKANVGTVEATVNDLFNASIILDGYGLSYAYKSPIGPLELTIMGSSNHARIYTYISLGFWF